MNRLSNSFKTALQNRDPQIGLWLSLPDASVAELCAGAGFDWLLLDGEHAPSDVRTMIEQLRAIAPYHSHPIARPPNGSLDIIKQYLDIGAQTLLVPMVDTAEQATALAAAFTYPPAGVRGVSSLTRAARWGRVDDYFATARDDLCLLVQVETTKGVENIEAIAATPGVDGVFIGPSDLAASMGFLGQPADRKVIDAIEKAISRVCAAGKPCGILAVDETLATRYLAQGCTFVAVGADALLLRRSADELRVKFAKIEQRDLGHNCHSD